MKSKVILITGASSGIGKACAAHLSLEGHTVYGTTRREGMVKTWDGNREGYSMVVMDVTSDSSVSDAVGRIIEKEGRLDVLVNNAGMGVAGPVEETETGLAKSQFETNFFGCHRVIREILPQMRKQGGGHIINIGSVAAYISIPYQSMYSASKAALQSMSFALRNETKPFGIKVSVVHPGDLKTGFTENRKKAEVVPKGSPYAKSYAKSLEVMEKDEQNGGDPVCVAKTIARIIKRANPPVCVTVGFKYKLFAFLFRIVPAALREKIVGIIYT